MVTFSPPKKLTTGYRQGFQVTPFSPDPFKWLEWENVFLTLTWLFLEGKILKPVYLLRRAFLHRCGGFHDHDGGQSPHTTMQHPPVTPHTPPTHKNEYWLFVSFATPHTLTLTQPSWTDNDEFLALLPCAVIELRMIACPSRYRVICLSCIWQALIKYNATWHVRQSE